MGSNSRAGEGGSCKLEQELWQGLRAPLGTGTCHSDIPAVPGVCQSSLLGLCCSVEPGNCHSFVLPGWKLGKNSTPALGKVTAAGFGGTVYKPLSWLFFPVGYSSLESVFTCTLQVVAAGELSPTIPAARRGSREKRVPWNWGKHGSACSARPGPSPPREAVLGCASSGNWGCWDQVLCQKSSHKMPAVFQKCGGKHPFIYSKENLDLWEGFRLIWGVCGVRGPSGILSNLNSLIYVQELIPVSWPYSGILSSLNSWFIPRINPCDPVYWPYSGIISSLNSLIYPQDKSLCLCLPGAVPWAHSLDGLTQTIPLRTSEFPAANTELICP